MYYLDAPVSDPIMFANDNQNSNLSLVEDGGLTGSPQASAPFDKVSLL